MSTAVALPSLSQPADDAARRAYDRAASHLARYVGCIPLAGPDSQCLVWDGVARRWYRQTGSGLAAHLREPTLLQELLRFEKEGYGVQGAAARYLALRQSASERNVAPRRDNGPRPSWPPNRAPASGRRAATTDRRPAPRYGPSPRSYSSAGAARGP